MASPALLGVFFCFAAMALLVIVSVSVPTWNDIYFLVVGTGAAQIRYGVFGFTGSKIAIGYSFQNERLNSTVLHNLTQALILHPIAAGLSGVAFLFGVCGAAARSRFGTIMMSLISGLAMITTFVAFVIDMVLFGIARQRYRGDNVYAQYGNANWLTLGALVALLMGFCTSVCGIFGRYRSRRDVGY